MEPELKQFAHVEGWDAMPMEDLTTLLHALFRYWWLRLPR